MDATDGCMLWNDVEVGSVRSVVRKMNLLTVWMETVTLIAEGR